MDAYWKLDFLDLSFDVYSSDDEDLQDLADLLEALPRPRVFKERRNIFENLSNEEFKKCYRLNKSTVLDLVQLLAPQLEPVSKRSKPVYAMDKVLLTLRYYATGSFQMTLGDILDVHQTTAGDIIHQVTQAIAMLRPQYVKMPQTEEHQTKIKQGFYGIAGFPGVIGALDGSHIKIKSPSRQIEEKFRNRKSWFSINIQSICDHDLRAMDIVARWPGSVHDMTVFNNSLVRAQIEAGEFNNGILLGDSGYACRKYLLTPFTNPQTQPQQKYNEAHILTRNPIERMFGVLKRRFPCLAVGMQIKLDKILSVIVATVVLHNIAIDHNDETPEPDPEVVLPPTADDIISIAYDGGNNNFAVRNAFVEEYFT